MNGLESGDYDALAEAIDREREIIDEQAEIIAEQKNATAPPLKVEKSSD
jgi:hypothetical protein